MKLTALVFAAALSLPLAAQADPVCEVLGEIAAGAGAMRQSGMDQRTAAQMLGGVIAAAAGQMPGTHAERQRLATLIGKRATPILAVVYSLPVERTEIGRDSAIWAGRQVIYRQCLAGNVL